MFWTILSWVGNIFIVLGIWYLGSKKRYAFVFSTVGEAAWIAYSAHLRLWSLTLMCVIFGFLAVRNYILWGKKDESTGEDFISDVND